MNTVLQTNGLCKTYTFPVPIEQRISVLDKHNWHDCSFRIRCIRMAISLILDTCPQTADKPKSAVVFHIRIWKKRGRYGIIGA